MATSIAKIAARDQRKAQRKAVKDQRRREWRCFWMRPLGHEYVDGACVECGRAEVLVPRYDARARAGSPTRD